MHIYIYIYITHSFQPILTQYSGVEHDLAYQEHWCYICQVHLTTQRAYSLHLQEVNHNLILLCRLGREMAFCHLCDEAMAECISAHRRLPKHCRMLMNLNSSSSSVGDEQFIEIHRPPVAPVSKAQLSQSIMSVANIIYLKHVNIHSELFYPPDEEVEEND